MNPLGIAKATPYNAEYGREQQPTNTPIKRLQERLARLEEDVEGILLERIRDKGNAARCDPHAGKTREGDSAGQGTNHWISKYGDCP